MEESLDSEKALSFLKFLSLEVLVRAGVVHILNCNSRLNTPPPPPRISLGEKMTSEVIEVVTVIGF